MHKSSDHPPTTSRLLDSLAKLLSRSFVLIPLSLAMFAAEYNRRYLGYKSIAIMIALHNNPKL